MNRSYLIAAAIALGATAWMLSGVLANGGEDAAAGRPDAKGAAAQDRVEQLERVQVRTFEGTERMAPVRIRGRTEALRAVEIRAEADGRVVELPIEKGARVSAGAVICRLATEDREAALAQARAELSQRRIEHDGAVKLAAKGFTSQTRAAEAKAQLQASEAAVKRMEVMLGQTRILAPFDGVLDQRPAELGDYLQKGSACGTVVDIDPMLMVGEISERDIGFVSVGDKGDAVLADGRKVSGTVRYVAQTARLETRTYRVELAVPNPDGALRDGLTAEILLPTRAVVAHRISPAMLTLDEAGRVGVRIVEDGDVVAFKPIELVADTQEGLWISGLPQRVRIITVGQEFVKSGQHVDVAMDKAGEAS